MSDMMIFPETWEEFEKSYGFDDSEEVYTNGSRLIPSFRVKQWLDHIAQSENKQQTTVSSDCISRQAAIDAIDRERKKKHLFNTAEDGLLEARGVINTLPSAEQCMTATSNTMVSDTVKIPVMDGTTERLPSAEPCWISCIERLPEDDVYVLISKKPSPISGKEFSVTIGMRYINRRSKKAEWRDSGFGYLSDDKVLAWMPLPEPYQPKEDES